jgi:hypothetical protein
VYVAAAEVVMRRTVVLGLVVVAACKGETNLDRGEVEAQVSAEAAKRVGVPVQDAGCPKAIKAAAGSSFVCNVAFKGGGTLAFKVDQVDAAGALSINTSGDWLLGDKMETDLKTELFLIGHPEAKVDCGDAVLPSTLPTELKCKVQNAGTAATEVAVSVDASRKVHWKLVGTL